MKALPLATVPADVEAETAPAVPGPSVSTPDGPASAPGAGVLEAVVRASTLLLAGWHAELGPGSIILSRHTS